MLEIQAQIHTQMEVDLTLSCLMMVLVMRGNPHVFPVWLNLIFPISPSPRCPITSFPYHSLWQFYFLFPSCAIQELECVLNSNLYLVPTFNC